MANYSDQIYGSLFETPKDLCKQDLKEFVGHKDEVNCVSYSSDFQFMVTGSDDERVRVFKVKTKQCLLKLKGHEGAIRSVAVSPCDKYFSSGSYDKTARVWRTANGECIHTLKGHTKSVEEVTFSPGAIYLCTASWDRTAILWNLKIGCMVKRFEGHLHAVQAVAFSYDFLMLATGSWDFTVRVWKLNHTDYKNCAKRYHQSLVMDTVDGEDKLLDEDGKENTNNDEINSNDETLGIEKKDTSQDDSESQDTQTYISTKDEWLTLKGHAGNVHAVAFSKIGMLASGSWDRTVRLWNPNTGWCLRLLVGHEGWVKAINFSHDSTYIASAADDDSVKVWDIPSGKCIKSFEASTDLAQFCAFTPSGILIASGSAIMEEKIPKKTKEGEEEDVESGEGKDDGSSNVETLLHKRPRSILKSANARSRQNSARHINLL